ncbi:recombinase family protein [Streptosporangium canum]|uniref:recombinase family protein n=1 Tax=Streptosporangium canum TaxID=324952 RepID=UPI0036ADBC3A
MDGQRRVGYARCSTNEQDVIVQTEQLRALGVEPDRIYIDRSFSGTTQRYNRGRRKPDFHAAYRMASILGGGARCSSPARHR